MNTRAAQYTTLVILFAWLSCLEAKAQFDIQLVADESTRPVGSSSPFNNLSVPAVDSGVVVFEGSGNGFDANGVFQSSSGGQPTPVVTNRTMIPGRSTQFANYGGLAIEDGQVLWEGTDGLNFSDFPIWTNQGGVTEVASLRTANPSVPGEAFRTVNDPRIESGAISYRGIGSDGDATGIYLDTPTGAQPLIDVSDFGPDGTPFANLNGSYDFDGERVVVGANLNSSFRGVVAKDRSGGAAQTLAAPDFLAPGKQTAFAADLFAFDVSVDEGNTVFTARDANGEPGLYLHDGAGLSLLYDNRDSVPGGAGTFSSFASGFQGLATSGDRTTFVATDADNRKGLYSDANGKLERVIDVGSVLDNKTVADIFLSNLGFDGNDIAFLARFDDGSEGVYVATANRPLAQPSVVFDGALPPPVVETTNAIRIGDGKAITDGDSEPLTAAGGFASSSASQQYAPALAGTRIAGTSSARAQIPGRVAGVSTAAIERPFDLQEAEPATAEAVARVLGHELVGSAPAGAAPGAKERITLLAVLDGNFFNGADEVLIFVGDDPPMLEPVGDGDLVSSVELELAVYVKEFTGATSFTRQTVFSQTATLDWDELTATSGWADAFEDPELLVTGGDVGWYVTMDFFESLTFEAPYDEPFAIELLLRSDSSASYVNTAGARFFSRADFLNTAGYSVSAATPGVTITSVTAERVPVIPEPSSVVCCLLGLSLLFGSGRRRGLLPKLA